MTRRKECKMKAMTEKRYAVSLFVRRIGLILAIPITLIAAKANISSATGILVWIDAIVVALLPEQMAMTARFRARGLQK